MKKSFYNGKLQIFGMKDGSYLSEASAEHFENLINSVRSVLTAEGKLPKILLVDDDLVFGKVMLKFSERSKLDLTYCPSIRELEHIHLSYFDILIMDYDLQNISGLQAIQSLRTRGNHMPAVLISAQQNPNIPPWVNGVLGFVHKSLGPLGLLSSALVAYHQVTSYKEAL